MSTHRSSITSVSWIPSEAIPMALMKVPVLLGIAHYDPVPPDRLENLEEMHADGKFRFANRLSAWIEVDGDEIVDAGYDGEGLISKTVAHFKVASFAFNPAPYPSIQQEPEYGDGWVRFVQTTGGRTGSPMPRKISRPPYVQVTAPLVWTTLSLTLHADGRAEYGVIGASPFPRHWFYDHEGTLVKKSGIADYKSWADAMDEGNSPWSDKENELLVADADLEQAVAAYEANELARAEGLIHQTYMSRFEGLEGDLIERNPELVSSLERDFNATLPLLMQQRAGSEEVQATLRSMTERLETAGAILESVEQTRPEVF